MVSAAAIALAACPETKPTDPDAGVPDAGVEFSPVELCDKLAAARCSLLARCYPAFARETASDCQLLGQSRCLDEYNRIKPSIEAQKLEIDHARVESCEQRLQTSACAPTFPPGYFSFVVSPFADCTLSTGLLRGKVASGETCDEPTECVAGTSCIKPGGVCKGTCSTFAQVDEPCGIGCEEGLYCDGKQTAVTTDDRCAIPKALNEPCDSSAQCDPSLWCADICKSRGSVGDVCIHDPARLSTCAPGLACDVTPFVSVNGKPVQGTCVIPKPAGSGCWYHWSCAQGLVCWELDWSGFPDAPPANPGTCAGRAPEGEGCSFTAYASFVGDTCDASLTCNAGGVCVTRPQLGESCEVFSQACAGQDVHCKPSESLPSKGTCTGPAAQNERCASKLPNGEVVQIPCESGFCDTETTLKCLPPNKAVGQECGSGGECLSGRCAVQEDRTLRCAEACL